MSESANVQSETSEHVERNSSTYKLLMVGNSFASDAANWLWNICQSAGIDVVVGVIDIGGCSLGQHWERVKNNKKAPFHKRDQTGETNEMISYRDVFSHDNWEVITFQQFSGDSGIYETFQPYLTRLREYAKTFTTNPQVKFGWHLTWAYATGSQHGEYVNYDHDQMSMYHAITHATIQAMDEMDFDIVIPSGTAIQNARTNEYLIEVGDELTSDGHHLDHGIGSFVAGLTVFETLIANTFKKDIFNDVSFNPLGDRDTKSLDQLAKTAAKNAVRRPFEVSEV